MTAISIMVRITVDPVGRVLVWENERTLPSDKITTNDGTGEYTQDVAGPWHANVGCVDYVLEVIVPTPPLPEPRVRVVPPHHIDGKIVKMGGA